MSLQDAQTACNNAAAAIMSQDYAAAERYANAGLAYLAASPTLRHGERAIELTNLERRFEVLLKSIRSARKSSGGIRFTSTTRVPLTGAVE